MNRTYGVAVIDSGIGNYCKYFQDSFVEQINFWHDSDGYIRVDCTSCFTGIHAVKVISTMEKYRTDKKYFYYNLNIVNKNGMSSSHALLKALEYLLKMDNINVITICLSYDNFTWHQQIQRCCSELKRKGKIIFLAANRHYDSISNSLKDVVCVKGGMFKKAEEYRVNPEQSDQIQGNILSEFVSFDEKRYLLFGGTSMATAKMASMLSEYYLQKRLGNVIHYASHDVLKDLSNTEDVSEKWIKKIWKMLLLVLQEINEYPNNLELKNYCTAELISYPEKYDLLIGGLSQWNPAWKVEKLNYYDFGTVYSIARWFEQNEKE